MKPFFTNPFKPLITRTGQAIGKAAERGMLQAVDGPYGIRKRFQVNPDGSKTMLHTQNGLARFKTDGITVCDVVVSPSELSYSGTVCRHFVTFTRTITYPRVLKIRFKDITAVGGEQYEQVAHDIIDAAPQDHVTFSGDTVTVTYDGGTGNNGAFEINVQTYPAGVATDGKTYQIQVGCAKAIGTLPA